MFYRKWIGTALGLMAVAVGGVSTSHAQFDPNEKAGLTAGIDGGLVLPSTDTAAKDEGDVRAGVYLRHGIAPKLQASLDLGYARLAGEDYSTDMGLLGLRLLYSPLVNERWNINLAGGVGALRYDLDELPPSGRIPGSVEGIGTVGMIPLGLGFQFKLSNRLALEAGIDYTLVLSDDINAVNIDSGDDAFTSLRLGLTLGQFGPEEQSAPKPMPKPMPMVDVDGDEDGLTDREEKTIYFTNPLKRDSDDDGLIDGDEVKKYKTNPNKADSDGGGVGDGEELGRGTDPLQAGDDVVEEVVEEEPAPMVEPEPVALPPLKPQTILFATSGSRVSSQASKALDALAAVLAERPGQKLILEGHADNSGSAKANETLSRKRAQAVKAYLVSKGIDAARLTIKAMGDRAPVASNETVQGRQQNRRVEILPTN